VLRVQGLASSLLLKPDAPLDAANRRISIIVMNREAEDRFFGREPEQDAPDATQAHEPAPSTSPGPAR
jgi:chemotaxis protein MotB